MQERLRECLLDDPMDNDQMGMKVSECGGGIRYSLYSRPGGTTCR